MLFTLNELLNISVAMFAGLMLTRLGNKFRLPDVTAYLVAGVLIGPSLLGGLNILGLGFHSFEELETLGVISDMALGFIAFSIGNEFRLSQLRETGKQALVIGILQAVITTLFVDCALLGVHFLFPAVLSIPAAITLGAIAAATAPAATLMVVRQYKAKGKLTDLLLPIVALDDAVGLILFAVSFGVARALGSGSVDIYGVLVNPLLEILCSLLLGALAGFVLSKIEPIFHSNRNRVAMSISFVFLTVALSMLKLPAGKATIGFSSLLVCMMLGSVFCNLCPLSDEIMHNADRWSAPLLVLFFVISGAELGVVPDGGLRQKGRGLPRHHAAAAGGRGARHVRDCLAAARRRAHDPQHRALRRAGLRAARPGGDQVGADKGRRHPAQERGSLKAPRAQARRGRGEEIGARLKAPVRRDREKKKKWRTASSPSSTLVCRKRDVPTTSCPTWPLFDPRSNTRCYFRLLRTSFHKDW